MSSGEQPKQKKKGKGKGNSLSIVPVAEQWRAAQTKEKGKRSGDGLRDDENAGGRSLSTVHFAEQWRAAQAKGKGNGKSSVTVMD
jgi:hypothetical protein